MSFRKLSSIESESDEERQCADGGWYSHEGHSSFAHVLLQDDVLGRITYDDPSVFRRLRVYDESPSAIDHCHERLHVEQAGNFFIKLLNLVRSALPHDDDEGQCEKTDSRRRAREASIEMEMTDSLMPILSHLTDFGPSGTVRRRFVDSVGDKEYQRSGQTTAAAYTPELLDHAPDLFLLDEESTRPFWERYVGLGVVKADPVDGDLDVTFPSAILQCVDYARTQLAHHHFWLFTVALLVIGTEFRVMIVDHAGVSLSPAHSIVADSRYDTGRPDTTLFVRVVRALTRELSEKELGQDPSVTPVSQRKFRQFVRRSSIASELKEQLSREDSESSPSYLVSVCDAAEQRTWCNVGHPIWVSESLFGRATNVWRAIEVVRPKKKRMFSGEVYVLKSSWRDPCRPWSEAEVYKCFEDCPPSIPRLLCGGDVLYEEGPGKLKTVDTAAVRGGWMDNCSGTKILHRLVLSAVGEPLWKYTNDLQLLRAFRAIIEAHQWLAVRGILHCDISPGNLLLASGPSAGVCGILTDFDGAYIDEELFWGARDRRGRTSPMQTNVMASNHTSSSLLGTRQFMAVDLLKAVARKGTAEHTAAHDLESMGYVFGYTIMRRLLVFKEYCPKKFRKAFERAFGGLTVDEIVARRCHESLWYWVNDLSSLAFFELHVSLDVLNVVGSLTDAIESAHTWEREKRRYQFSLSRRTRLYLSPRSPPKDHECTHAVFLAALDEGIRWLEDNPSKVETFLPP